MYINEKHKEIVENRGYGYIGSYRSKEVTLDNKCNNKTYVRVKCPYCKKEYDTMLDGFNRGNKCRFCCHKYENSFAYYIQQELNEPLNKYWDWEKNTVNPYCIPKQYNGKVWIKCIKTNYHGSYEIRCDKFYKGIRCPYCANRKVHPKDSFAQWGIDNICKDFLEKYWSDKNILNPRKIPKKSSKKKVWLKCQKKDYHNDYGGYEVTCCNFTNGRRCPYCTNNQGKVHPLDSFAGWGINNIDKDFLDKYWSNKNTINPFDLSPHSDKKIWIKCQNTYYHEDYLIICDSFIKGSRCPYCSHKKIHPKDSFGALYPEKAKYRSKKNKKSPFEVAPKSDKKYWFYCEDCGEEYEVQLNNLANGRSLKCLNCTSSKGEQRINDWLSNNNINFITQKKFFGLVGLNGGNLSYDFYLPQHNLLIEYQGRQHEHFVKGLHNSKKDFEKQVEHDKRKRDYAKKNNIDLLEIRYWDFDNIENILSNYIINKGELL